MNNTLTDAIYWASKDPRIVALQKLVTDIGAADIGARDIAGAELDAEGLVIDRQVDIWGWDPTLVMGMRQADGYLWCRNAYQPMPDSLLDFTDISKRNPRSILISTDAADYESFAPVVAPPPTPTSPIGPANAGMYSVMIQNAQNSAGRLIFSDGQQYSENGKTYTFHNQPGMFGPVLWWSLNQAA